MDLTGKVVIITGASSGIGRELARQLSAKGAKLALLARREDALRTCAAEECAGQRRRARRAGRRHPPEQCASAVAATFDAVRPHRRARELRGRGLLRADRDACAWRTSTAMLRTNVYGLLYMTQAALPYLKESRGMLVNVSQRAVEARAAVPVRVRRHEGARRPALRRPAHGARARRRARPVVPPAGDRHGIRTRTACAKRRMPDRRGPEEARRVADVARRMVARDRGGEARRGRGQGAVRG